MSKTSPIIAGTMNWGVWDKTSIKGNGKHDSHLFRKQNKQL
jgi:hypothetical protein